MGKAPTQFCSKSIFVNFLQSLPAWTKMKSKFKQYAYCTLWPNLCWNYIRLANLKHEKLAQRENQTNFLKGGDSMIQITIDPSYCRPISIAIGVRTMLKIINFKTKQCCEFSRFSDCDFGPLIIFSYLDLNILTIYSWDLRLASLCSL